MNTSIISSYSTVESRHSFHFASNRGVQGSDLSTHLASTCGTQHFIHFLMVRSQGSHFLYGILLVLGGLPITHTLCRIIDYHIFLGILEYHEEIPSLGVLPAAPLKLVENHARIPCKCYPYEKTRKIISLQNMEKCTK